MNKKWSVRMLAEGGIMIALSVLLSLIKIYQMPNGGSVTAGSMVPILLFALKWGLGPGVTVGVAYGIIDFIIKPSFYHPIQALLDYPIAYGLLGLAGIFYVMSDKDSKSDTIKIALGISLAVIGRMIAHVLSGVIFFAEYAGDMNPWLYSISYNASFLVPELLISVVIIVLIWKPIKSFIVR